MHIAFLGDILLEFGMDIEILEPMLGMERFRLGVIYAEGDP